MVTSRIRFTAAQKAELWERWKNGQSAAAISRALERKNKTGVESGHNQRRSSLPVLTLSGLLRNRPAQAHASGEVYAGCRKEHTAF